MSIQVTACLNPFSGERKEFSFEQGITINEIIRNLDALNAVNTGWRVMIDDEIITDFERVPEEGQRVYIKLVPEGDNNKDSGAGMKIAGGLLTVVGVILAFTPAAALGFCLIGCGVGMFTGGVVLYNTDIPSLSDREKPEQDPSIRGSRNQTRPYGKVPVLLGKRRIYADACANPYTWVDSEGAIWLHQLFCVAQKDIQIDTSTLKIDETLLKDYSATGDISRVLNQLNPDPLIQMKISYGDSTPPLYDKCVHEIQLNTVLKHQTEDGQDGSVIRTTPAKTTKINVDVFFYNGLGEYNDEGNVVTTFVKLRAEYKKSTDPDSAYQLLGYFSKGSNLIFGSELKTKRYAITKDNLTADSYTVKISRVTEDSTDTKIIDTVYVGSIRAASNDTPVRSARCRQVTLIGLKIKASEKLNNIVEQLNFVAQSRMPIYNSQTHQWTNALTSNPASAAMYAMQGEVAQQRLSNSDIDLDSFAALYSWCANHDYECNAYITDDMTINDLLSSIASTCRAEILRMNGKITVIQDIAKDSFVQLFTPRNSHDYKETMALADIPDVLKMGIVDKTNGYAENEVPVYNTPSGNPVPGVEPQTSQSVPLWGVTDSVQARKLAMYNYAVSKHRFIAVKFSCDFEYLMCRKGDWIKYAGDIALAGLKQGRIEAVDGQKLILDEQVTMESGKTYAVRIRKSDGTAALCNVQTVVGTSNEITISGQIPSGVEGCLFAFGITGNETIDLIVTDIQCGENLSADLTCVEYAPEIFGVDDPDFVLPDFINKLSDVDSVVEPGVVDGWRTFATYNDSDSTPETPTGGGTSGSWHLQQTENSKWISTKTAASIYEGEWSAPMPTGKKVMDVLVPEGEIGNPGVVSGLTAVANQNEIVINWDPLGNGLKNTIKRYYVEIKKGNNDWQSFTFTTANTARYVFDRTSDGYPEYKAFNNWKFRVKAENIYGKLSAFWAETLQIDTTHYGTWTIPPIFVQKEVIDRTVILTALYEGPKRDGNPIELYGTVKTNVLIKRNGNMDEISDGVTFNDYLGVTPDDDWYTPEFELKPTPSETEDTEKNYCHYGEDGKKTKTPFVSNTYKISHTLPLIGQNPRLFDAENASLDMFSCDAIQILTYAERTTEPASPSVGDLILFNGTTTSDFTNGRYYRYGFSAVTPVGTENPLEEGWYEKNGRNYILTTDTAIKSGKIYYETEWIEIALADVIHFTNENNVAPFEKNKFYRFATRVVSSVTEYYWKKLISKKIFVPTEYDYKIQMFIEESGSVSNEVEVSAQALCTNISDFVHSHEYYKDLYVEKLSAINANIGLISKGGMGSFADQLNYWALSTLTAEESGVVGGVLKGAFRVGGENEYFKVTPYLDEQQNLKYKIELKAGNIELTSDVGEESALDFTNGTYIYNGTKTRRMALTPKGIVVEKKFWEVDADGTENPLEEGWYEYSNGGYVLTEDETVTSGKTYYTMRWDATGQVTINENNDMIIANTKDIPELGYELSNADVYHFDGTALDEDGNNPQSIIATGDFVPNDEQTRFLITTGNMALEGTVTKNISQTSGVVGFVTKSAEIQIGQKAISMADGSFSDIPVPLTGYNEAMIEESTPDSSKTLGQYLGLTQSQIDAGIFY